VINLYIHTHDNLRFSYNCKILYIPSNIYIKLLHNNYEYIKLFMMFYSVPILFTTKLKRNTVYIL
jgi:hypothetical protein